MPHDIRHVISIEDHERMSFAVISFTLKKTQKQHFTPQKWPLKLEVKYMVCQAIRF